MWDNEAYEDQSTDELAYGRCAICHQIEELGPGDMCLVCEGSETKMLRESSQAFKSYYNEHYQ